MGRVYKAYNGDPEDYSGPPWVGGLPFSLKFDYSAEGFQRSYEDSTLRLGLNRIDLLVIHDLDRGYHGDSVPEKLRQFESGIFNDYKKYGEMGPSSDSVRVSTTWK